MGAMPTDFSSFDTTAYNQTDIGLQDFASMPTSSLDAPSLDSGLGTDPLTGELVQPSGPSVLTDQPMDNSNGLNASNNTLLPYVNTSNPTNGMIDPSLLSGYQQHGGQGKSVGFSNGMGLAQDQNLPLTTPDTMNQTTLITYPKPAPMPLGFAIWSQVVSVLNPVLGLATGRGVAGKPTSAIPGTVPGVVNKAPHTRITNPIPAMNVALIVFGVFAIIGALIWSFKGEV